MVRIRMNIDKYQHAKEVLEAKTGAKYFLLDEKLAKWYAVEPGLYKYNTETNKFYDPRLDGLTWFDPDKEKEVY